MIVYAEGDTPELEAEAQWILFSVLAKFYPGHPWSVRAYSGGFFIRHLGFPANWGMNCPDQRKLYSASAYQKLVVIMAGEWLERAGLKRGRYDSDQEIEHLEGAPASVQPHRPLPDDVNLILPENYNPEVPKVRDVPRPQALKH